MSGEAGNIEVDPRVVFAAERTLLAWIRTGIALAALGFVVARFAFVLQELGIKTASGAREATYVGVSLVLAAGGLMAWATVHHERTLGALRRGAPLGSRRAPLYFGLVTALAALALALLLLRGP
jgi:putative membrane protein